MEDLLDVDVPLPVLDDICGRHGWSPVHYYASLLELRDAGIIRFVPAPDSAPDVVAADGIAALRESLDGASLQDLLGTASPMEQTPDEAAESMAQLRDSLGGLGLDDLTPQDEP